jgi:hypothetical protein
MIFNEGMLVRVIGGNDGKTTCNDIGRIVKVSPKMVKFCLLRCEVIASKSKKNLAVIPEEEVEGAIKKALTEKENYDPEQHGDSLMVFGAEATKEELKIVLEQEFGTVENCQYLPFSGAFLVSFTESKSAKLAVEAKSVIVALTKCRIGLADTVKMPPKGANNSTESRPRCSNPIYQPNGAPLMPKRSLFERMKENQGAESKRRRLG